MESRIKVHVAIGITFRCKLNTIVAQVMCRHENCRHENSCFTCNFQFKKALVYDEAGVVEI